MEEKTLEDIILDRVEELALRDYNAWNEIHKGNVWGGFDDQT